MIKVSIIYPNIPGSGFDFAYYLDKHIPMVRSFLQPAGLRKLEVNRGVGGVLPEEPPPFHAAIHLYFDSMESFTAAFEPHVDALMSDIPNYTSVPPTLQVSDVVLTESWTAELTAAAPN